MIHKCAELGPVWPVQLLGSKSMAAVFVKAGPSPPIPHAKQGWQQKLNRIKVLDKAMSWFYSHFVSCFFHFFSTFFQFPVHSFCNQGSQGPDEADRNLSVILEMKSHYLASDPESSILCKTELLAKPLCSHSPCIAFHPHENLKSELYSVVCVPFCLIFIPSHQWRCMVVNWSLSFYK